MTDAWTILCRAGVPEATPLRGGVSESDIQGALVGIESTLSDLDEVQRDALGAWLAAFEHDWPAAFAAIAGPVGSRLAEALAATRADANRHLKLRRLARAHLATLF